MINLDRLLEDNSFDILVDSSNEKQIFTMLKGLVERMTQLPLKSSHNSHQFEALFVRGTDPNVPPVCGVCDMILIGTLFSGYKCNDCSKFYHEKCFLQGTVDQKLVEGLGTLYKKVSFNVSVEVLHLKDIPHFLVEYSI